MSLIVKLYGGLAGQMTQYAFGKYLEIFKREKVCFDISFFSNQSHNQSFRKFELLNWNTNICLATEQDYNAIYSKVKILDKLNFKIFNKKVVKNNIFIENKPFEYDNEVLKSNYKIYDGYWVCNSYMNAIREILIKDFTPRYPISLVNEKILEKIKNKNSISIHFRRGDYVNSIHDVLKEDYYINAIKIMNEQFINPVFIIFSDDMNYVKSNYKFNNDCIFIDHNIKDESYWDIFLMSNCKHNVIANSGFSFWGAWLNNNPNKKVIAPKDWLDTENKITKNLILSHWTII